MKWNPALHEFPFQITFKYQPLQNKTYLPTDPDQRQPVTSAIAEGIELPVYHLEKFHA